MLSKMDHPVTKSRYRSRNILLIKIFHAQYAMQGCSLRPSVDTLPTKSEAAKIEFPRLQIIADERPGAVSAHGTQEGKAAAFFPR